MEYSGGGKSKTPCKPYTKAELEALGFYTAEPGKYVRDAGKTHRDDIEVPDDLPDNCNLFFRREDWGDGQKELYIYARGADGYFYSKRAGIEMHNEG